ncbi:alcohol dehydrogenase family protein [Nocardiopsis ansamitocini]|uniref:Zn-dependent oxidoreductase n=1 Tax=Nocardiopsis ansamitocini TaxID=1670832 RepID=A0A9W6UKI3_9ACTN|nr:alcohol dehydrogenase family protein [Nocardiopsis ansamitocini]GLU49999.1 Zn-dependent oxidoreductase [Nocardiopsis ansamitocini]
MHAMVLTGFGGPEKLEYRTEHADPLPGPGEVRVRVGAAGMNNTDIWTRQGAYGVPGDPGASAGWRREPLAFPRIQGADVAGRIDRVGAGVARSRIGERVLVDPMLYSGGEVELVDTAYLGSERDGGFAELVTVPAGNAHRIDSALSDEELATFPTAYATAMRMLNRSGLSAGETILVTGASGGVGSALVQLASARGARVIAVVGAAKRDRAIELGADATVARETEDLAARVRVAAAGRPVEVVADVVAGPMFPALIGLLAPLGRYVVAGAMAGAIVSADLRTVYLRQLSLIGSSFGTHDDFARLVAHIEAGELRPLLAGSYPLGELAAAQEAFAAKEFFGKLVVRPGE